jgi:DNA-binding response OmpR family regulator
VSARILIIEDDADHADSIADVLTAHGYEVEIALSGELGIARFRDSDFDVTLMDVKLPGMNGVETFFQFRKIRPDAKVIMMTGFSVEHLIAQAVDGGAIGVLYKPIAIIELLTMLERVKPRGLVLVADDDLDFSVSVEPMLRQHGYSVSIARTGQEAFEKGLNKEVDCLLLDLRLPILSGLEVYVRLREAGHAIPTILVTAYADEENQTLQQLRPYTDGLLIKPFDPALLLRKIEAAIASRRH